MNARDNLKPKSIRLSILQALSDGAITTIDDLQIKMDEPRKKVVDNAVHAANDGLIKRLRDDVTNLAAYQITQHGRDYLAKYVSGKEDEPSLPEVPVCAESQTAVITPGVKADVFPRESIDEAHKKAVMAWEMSMMAAIGEDGISDVVKAVEKIKQEREAAWFELAAIRSQIGRIRLMVENHSAVTVSSNEPVDIILADILHNSEHVQEPVGYVVQRPAKVLVRVSKLDRAEERALCFARREGKRAKVFALIPVGESVPGAEWKEA